MNNTTTQQTINNFHNPLERHMVDGYLVFRHDESILVSNSYITSAINKANDKELSIHVSTQGKVLIFIANGQNNEVIASGLNKNTPVNNQEDIKGFVISILDYLHSYLVNQAATR